MNTDPSVILQLFKEGKSGPQISRETGVSMSAIYRALKRAGISPQQVRRERAGKFTSQQRAEILRRYEQGESLAEIASAYSCCTATVTNVVRRLGGRVRPAHGQLRTFTDEVVAEMVRMWEAGQSQTAIGERFGIHQVQVSRLLRGRGYNVQPRRPQGERHGNWKGGRVRQGSYIYVLVPPDSPYRCMALVTGYVAEHRLVMAQALGRPLNRHETVHHINGDREDNRLENLQLRVGKHGQGARYQCLDCGSHNIESVELD